MNYKLDRTKSERILRDLYLRDLHLGKIQGPLTGNIFVDKNWVVRFTEKEIADFSLHDTLYNNYKSLAEQHLDEPAVYVFEYDKIYTHREILDLVDKASSGFKELGINENSKVGIFLNNTVEEAVTLLALSKLGALGKYIDFMKSVASMARSVAETDLDLLIMDECFLPLEEIVNKKGLPVVVANTNNDIDYNDNERMSFNNLYRLGTEEVVPAPYVEYKPSIMINSSGTTGDAKPIVLSDFILNSAAKKVLYTDYPIENQNVLVKMIPSQIGLGLITSLYTGLVSNSIIALIRSNNIAEYSVKLNEFVKNYNVFLKKYNLKPDTKLNIFTAPIFIRSLIKDDSVLDLSMLGSILGAGSKMTEKELKELDEIAQAKGCEIPLNNGYGQNEKAGAVSLNTVKHNKNGSAGYPTIGTNIRIVNPDTLEILGPNEEGLILEDSDTHFLRYENMPEKTKEADITLPDGTTWFNSCDLGYMDNDGYLWITGRTTRVVNRKDFKISMEVVEEKIRNISSIEDCGTITTGQIETSDNLIAFIKSDTLDSNEIANRIKHAGLLADVEIPDEFICLEEMPYKNGKIDYAKLKELYKEIGLSTKRIRTLE